MTRRRNRLLARLPDADYLRLLPDLEPVHLPRQHSLYQPGRKLDFIYFPVDCIVSLGDFMQHGPLAEVVVTGAEGLVGVETSVGGINMPRWPVVHKAGHAFRLDAGIFRRECARSQALQHLLSRYSQVLIIQMMQVAICNRNHSVEQQTCRFLLSRLDRVSADALQIDASAIAGLLGVSDQEVAAAIQRLQDAGIVRESDAQLLVTDRPALELLACGCHALIRHEHSRLLSADTAAPASVIAFEEPRLMDSRLVH